MSSDFFLGFCFYKFVLYVCFGLVCRCNIFSHFSKELNVKAGLEVFLYNFCLSRLFSFYVCVFESLSSVAFLRCLLTVGCLLMFHSWEVKMYWGALNRWVELVNLRIIVE